MRFNLFLLCLVILTFVSLGISQRGGIRKVDFKNHDFGTLCGGPHPFLALTGDKLVLKNGHAEQGDNSNYTDLESVTYVDLDGDGSEEAFLVINGQTSGSSGSYVAAYVYGYANGRPKQLWTKCEENSTAQLTGRHIVFTSPEWAGADAHCCFRFVRSETFAMRGRKVSVIRTVRRRTDSAKADAVTTIDDLAAELAEAFARGDLARLDAKKPYQGKITLIVKDSLSERTTRKTFTSLRAATKWLKRSMSDINFNGAELDHCRKGICKVKPTGGLLHNNLYLRQFSYTTIKGRHYITTISILDGD